MAMKVRVLLSSVVVMTAMWLVGCGHYICHSTFGNATCTPSGGGVSQGGGGGSTGAQDAFLFVADAGGVQGETLNVAAGTITNTAGFVVPVVPNVLSGWMVIAQEKYMYVAYPSTGQIYGWTINSDGTVEFLNDGNAYPASYMIGSTMEGSQSMIANPAGTLLFVMNQVSGAVGKVYVYTIGSDGTLTMASGSPLVLPSGFEPENLAVDGLGKYLYVSNLVSSGTSAIAAYNIAASGTLTPVTGSPFVSPSGSLEFSMWQMQGESSGKYMVGTTSSVFFNDPHIYVYSIQSTGAIVPVSGSPFATTNPPSTITVQPSQGGDLVYSFSFDNSGNTNPVEGFTLSLSSGSLTTISGSPFAVNGSYGLFDQSGTYLFVTDPDQKNNTAYDVSSSSSLTKQAASVGWGPGAWAPTDIP